jgi:hypothetical protein
MASFLGGQRDAKGNFDIYDIFLRCLALDELAGKNDFGMDLWKKCHQRRFAANNDNPTEDECDTKMRLMVLLEAMKKKNMLHEHPIITGNNGVVGDGGHRLAVSVWLGADRLFFRTSGKFSKGGRNYGSSWLRANDFSESEIEDIEIKRHEIMSDYHIYFPIIIWPPAMDFAHDIEADLKNTNGFDHIRSQTLSLNTKSEFENFVRTVYSADDIALWKIERKIAFMELVPEPYQVRIIWLDNRYPNFRKKSSNDALISSTNEALKRAVREKYKSRVSNYVNDIILHIGDNYRHNAIIDMAINHI